MHDLWFFQVRRKESEEIEVRMQNQKLGKSNDVWKMREATELASEGLRYRPPCGYAIEFTWYYCNLGLQPNLYEALVANIMSFCYLI